LEALELHANLPSAEKAFDDYRAQLLDVMQQHRDSDVGLHENEQVKALERGFAELKASLLEAQQGPSSHESLLARGTRTRQAIDALVRMADDLVNTINDAMKKRIDGARDEYRTSITILLSTSGLAVLVMVGLLRFFYAWVVSPLRDLEQ